MLEQIKFGGKLYVQNFAVLAMVGLPIYVPSNLLLNCLCYGVSDPISQIRLAGIHSSIVSALESGVVIATLNQLARGKPVRLGSALSSGVKNWLSIFATNIIANLICGFGLLAFVIPGIICLVRYALLDIVVVLENRSGINARERSWELTRGCGWSILFVYCVFYPLIIACGFIPLIAAEFVTMSADAWFAVDFVFGCLIDLTQPLFTAILFSFYWHATGLHSLAADSVTVVESPETPPLPWQDDSNPYQSPQSM